MVFGFKFRAVSASSSANAKFKDVKTNNDMSKKAPFFKVDLIFCL